MMYSRGEFVATQRPPGCEIPNRIGTGCPVAGGLSLTETTSNSHAGLTSPALQVTPWARSHAGLTSPALQVTSRARSHGGLTSPALQVTSCARSHAGLTRPALQMASC